jgi:hypothetical protein
MVGGITFQELIYDPVILLNAYSETAGPRFPPAR